MRDLAAVLLTLFFFLVQHEDFLEVELSPNFSLGAAFTTIVKSFVDDIVLSFRGSRQAVAARAVAATTAMVRLLRGMRLKVSSNKVVQVAKKKTPAAQPSHPPPLRRFRLCPRHLSAHHITSCDYLCSSPPLLPSARVNV